MFYIPVASGRSLLAKIFLLPVSFSASFAWGQDSVLMLDNPAQLPEIKSASERSLSLKAATFLANDSVPLSKLEDSPWPANYSKQSGTNLVLGHLRLELSASRKGWSAGYFHREDWRLRSNRDTMDAYALGLSNQLKGLDRRFDLDYEVQGFAADGLKIGYAWRMPFLNNYAKHNENGKGLVAGVSVSLMQGGNVRVESANGTLVSQVASASVSGVRSVNYSGLDEVPGNLASGFNDFTPAWPRSMQSGLGYGLDIGASYLFDNGGSISFAVNDLMGRLEWENVPQIKQSLKNLADPFVFSNGGAATFEKTSSYSNLAIKLSPKYQLAGVLPVGDKFIFNAQLESVDQLWFPQLGVSYPLLANWRLGLNYETRFGSAGLSLQHPRFFVALSSESFSLNESPAMGFAMGMNLPF